MATTWHTVATKDVRLLRKQLDVVSRLPREQVFLNYLRCHDDIGWGLDYPTLESWGMYQAEHKQFLNNYFRGLTGADARGELYNEDPVTRDARLCGTTASLCGLEGENKADAIRLDITLHAMMLFQSGIPVLYSGDEIGQKNDWDYKKDPNKAADSRYLHRGRMPWELAEKTGEPGSAEGQIFAGLDQLENLRREKKTFAAHADFWTWDTGSDRVLGLGRWLEGQLLLGLFNFGDEGCTVKLDDVYADMLTGELRSYAVELPGRGFAWLEQEL